MKACVIGGGPSGLYISDYLSKYGFDIELFEKSNSLLGNYKYARDKIDAIEKISLNPNIKIHMNSDESAVDDSSCDFYVLATGATQKELEIDGKQYLTKAIDVIKKYYYDGTTGLKNDVCIIGMGNVALDLVHYLKDSVRSITVLSRSGMEDAAFDNHAMRGIVDSDYFDVNLVNADLNRFDESRKAKRRYEIFKDQKTAETKFSLKNFVGCFNRNRKTSEMLSLLMKFVGCFKPSLNLIFKATPSSVLKEGSSLRLNYLSNGKLKSDLFDSVISSVGFVSNIPNISTSKKVYQVGWCSNPKGNIGDSKIDARYKAEEIANSLFM